MRDLPCHPLVLRVGAGHPLGGFRVLDETLSVVGYPPDVKVVIEYSVVGCRCTKLELDAQHTRHLKPLSNDRNGNIECKQASAQFAVVKRES